MIVIFTQTDQIMLKHMIDERPRNIQCCFNVRMDGEFCLYCIIDLLGKRFPKLQRIQSREI